MLAVIPLILREKGSEPVIRYGAYSLRASRNEC